MRVSSSQYHTTVNISLQNSNSQLATLMTKMSTGNRLVNPSDDPISYVRVSRLQREEANNDQYLSNISALSSRMTQSESMLTNINNDLLETRDLLVWALDGTNTTDDLQAMATSLASLRDGILASARTKDQEGNYLFSGTATRKETVVFDANQPAGQRYSAGGNDKQQIVQVGNGITQPANVSLEHMGDWLNDIDLAIETLQKLQPGETSSMDSVRTVLQKAMATIDTGMDEVSTKISKLGGGQNVIATMERNLSNMSTANQMAILDYSQLDYAEAAVQLNTLTAAIKATQSAYAQVSKLSLFDAL